MRITFSLPSHGRQTVTLQDAIYKYLQTKLFLLNNNDNDVDGDDIL